MTERFLVSESLQTHPRRESGENIYFASEINYSFFIDAAACFPAFAFVTPSFQSLAHFTFTNTKASGTIGDTQETMTISVTSFRGCNRFSPLLIYACLILFESCWSVSSFTLNVNCPPLFCIVVACFSIKN